MLVSKHHVEDEAKKLTDRGDVVADDLGAVDCQLAQHVEAATSLAEVTGTQA